MIYVTGDIHGNQILWDVCVTSFLKSGDIIIVAGDFGMGFFDGCYWSEEMFYDYLSEQQYVVLWVDGNHENFDKLNSYPVSKWNGGRVHRIRHNIIHLMRGEVYELDGRRLFTFGGGNSLDKGFRIPGRTWWPDEMPCSEEYDNAICNLERYNYEVDYIITHTCPKETVEYMACIGLGVKKNVIEEAPLTEFLQYIQSKTIYKAWYFGHFHVDVPLWRNQYALLHGFRDLETGNLIKSRV